jgi:arylsulfatase
LWPGKHEVVLDFRYDGGPPGSGGEARILLDGVLVGRERIEATTAYYFAFDESFNVGIDRGSPVVDDYPALRNAFTGEIRRVVVDLDEGTALDPATMTRLATRELD